MLGEQNGWGILYLNQCNQSGGFLKAQKYAFIEMCSEAQESSGCLY